MKSKTLPSFWDAYQILPDEAKKASEIILPTLVRFAVRPIVKFQNVLNRTTGPWVS